MDRCVSCWELCRRGQQYENFQGPFCSDECVKRGRVPRPRFLTQMYARGPVDPPRLDDGTGK